MRPGDDEDAYVMVCVGRLQRTEDEARQWRHAYGDDANLRAYRCPFGDHWHIGGDTVAARAGALVDH